MRLRGTPKPGQGAINCVNTNSGRSLVRNLGSDRHMRRFGYQMKRPSWAVKLQSSVGKAELCRRCPKEVNQTISSNSPVSAFTVEKKADTLFKFRRHRRKTLLSKQQRKEHLALHDGVWASHSPEFGFTSRWIRICGRKKDG